MSPSPSIDKIIRITAEEFNESKQDLLRSERGRGKANFPRTVAVGLCRKLAGMPLQEIADRFRMGHDSSVTASVNRLKARIQGDRRLATRVEAVRDRLGEAENR